MPAQTTKTARQIALRTLDQFDRSKKDYAAKILDKYLPQTTEKQRATDLVLGCVRNRTAIDMLVAKIADCPTQRIPAKIINIIRVAAYELIYCPQTPEYAVVNEAVENTKAVSGKKATSFVNAVLRQITRSTQNRQIPLEDADAKKTLPQNLSTGCQFNIEILPDPKTAPLDYYTAAFSLPSWLVEEWLTQLGTQKLKQICFASNRHPGLYIRPNTLKTTTKKLTELFAQDDIEFDIVEDTIIRVKNAKAVTALPGFTQGLFTVQDLAAYQVLASAKFDPGDKILDLCAAPGTKTTQLAEITHDKAKIFATDIDDKRLEKLTQNAQRLQTKSINIFKYRDMQKIAEKNAPFDTILLDVPCSNTAVLAKRPEVRYRIKKSVPKSLTKTQITLIETAASMLKPKGTILYSTCSIQNSENAELVTTFISKNPDFTLKYQSLTIPSAETPDHDGGYFAILTKQ
ncbi:MAG: methyltransferase domain-containing protein [Planctomycetes bacterium]|nr:methyltransferase domain-containing protein [Planctomycetota bacterium]